MIQNQSEGKKRVAKGKKLGLRDGNIRNPQS